MLQYKISLDKGKGVKANTYYESRDEAIKYFNRYVDSGKFTIVNLYDGSRLIQSNDVKEMSLSLKQAIEEHRQVRENLTEYIKQHPFQPENLTEYIKQLGFLLSKWNPISECLNEGIGGDIQSMGTLAENRERLACEMEKELLDTGIQENKDNE